MLAVISFSVVITLILSVLASWEVFKPFVAKDPELKDETEEQISLSDLLLRKEIILGSLEDLEQDFAVAKITEQQYILNKRELSAEAVYCLDQINTVSQKISNASN